MLTDLRSALFWLCCSLVMLVILQHGCHARMDQFHEWRQGRQDKREQRREDQQDDSHHGRWRRHAREDGDSSFGDMESEAGDTVGL